MEPVRRIEHAGRNNGSAIRTPGWIDQCKRALGRELNGVAAVWVRRPDIIGPVDITDVRNACAIRTEYRRMLNGRPAMHQFSGTARCWH